MLIHPSAANAGKFINPDVTADGKTRASVALRALQTLWFNTGTLCNLTCANCYIESSPRNDRLAYLEMADVVAYLDQIEALKLPTSEIGFTGGEPFMNPAIIDLLTASLERGYRTLVLTNAMRPMTKHADALLALRARFDSKLVLRVSVDHHRRELHEEERGRHTWLPTLRGLKWLSDNGFALNVAGRLRWGDAEASMREGFATLFASEGLSLNASDPVQLVLFPEMDLTASVPEITAECWGILHKRPEDVMCASSRMVVRHKGAAGPTVVSCTLLPYDRGFDLGPRLADALNPIKLNHPHCAKFCVLGGGRCSA
jgi:sulfatase maturation enzyme AslB (radical SAM superfamily)